MPYPGGKGGAGVYQTIINGMPRHGVYVEPFLGGGAVMAAKRSAGLNIGVDLDAEVIAQARTRIVGNDDTRSALAGCGDAAADALVTMREDIARKGDVGSSLAGCGDAADSTGTTMRDCTVGNDIIAGAIVSDGDNGRYEFYVGDGTAFLHNYPFHGGELVYADPPYLHATRRDHCLYRYEMTDQQHETLLRILLRLPCLVCVSGYWSELYAETLSAWRSCSFQAQTRRGIVTEWLWCNYPVPTALHDYRYLGKDFRERERIKRMTARWVNRLQAMPILQRQALQAALAQVDNGVGLYRQG
jgi:DNA adenine methylase